MSGDGWRQIRGMLNQYRMALLIAASVVALAALFGQHINNNDEAAHALGQIYGSAPHFELRLTEIPHPTR